MNIFHFSTYLYSPWALKKGRCQSGYEERILMILRWTTKPCHLKHFNGHNLPKPTAWWFWAGQRNLLIQLYFNEVKYATPSNRRTYFQVCIYISTFSTNDENQFFRSGWSPLHSAAVMGHAQVNIIFILHSCIYVNLEYFIYILESKYSVPLKPLLEYNCF